MRSVHLVSAVIAFSLACGLAAAAAFLYWNNDRNDVLSGDWVETSLVVSRIKRQFQAEHPPVVAFALQDLEKTRAAIELSLPDETLPQTDRFPVNELAALARYAESCLPTEIVSIRAKKLLKALFWQRYLCGGINALPEGFFEQPPFLHPSGTSFAWLAFRSGQKEFAQAAWIKRHQRYFHLKEVLRSPELGGPGLKVNAWELKNLLARESMVLTGDAVLFLADSSQNSFPNGSYSAHKKQEWHSFLDKQELITDPGLQSPKCLLREGNTCWLRNPQAAGEREQRLLILVFAVSLALLSAMVVFAWRWFALRRQEAKKRVATLQLLTHELRTPATAMRLSMESMRRDFDQLPQASQRAFLNICDELQRLDRVVDASRMYLQVSVAQESLAGHFPSVNGLITGMLEPFQNEVQFTELSHDRAIKTNAYWLEVCLRNLLENAFRHGRKPVALKLETHGAALVIAVADAGDLDRETLDELSEPFRKRPGSSGLGLGLTVVRNIAKAMNAELEYSTNPTIFRLKLRDSL